MGEASDVRVRRIRTGGICGLLGIVLGALRQSLGIRAPWKTEHRKVLRLRTRAMANRLTIFRRDSPTRQVGPLSHRGIHDQERRQSKRHNQSSRGSHTDDSRWSQVAAETCGGLPVNMDQP